MNTVKNIDNVCVMFCIGLRRLHLLELRNLNLHIKKKACGLKIQDFNRLRHLSVKRHNP